MTGGMGNNDVFSENFGRGIMAKNIAERLMKPLNPEGTPVEKYTLQVNIGKEKEGCRRSEDSEICYRADGLCQGALDSKRFDEYCWDNSTNCDLYLDRRSE